MYGLIDGDIIAFRSAISAQELWDDEIVIDSRKAIRNADKLIGEWMHGSRAKMPILTLSPKNGGNFRKVINPDYKANRKGTDKPVAYNAVIEHLENNYKVSRIEGLEADDVMGIHGSNPRLKGSVVITIDKDLLTVPCKLFNPMKMKRPQMIRPFSADHAWMIQTLMGDKTDGYAGAKGIGPKKAEAALGDCGNVAQMWKAVTALYEKQGQTEQEALLNTRMARILRYEDYDESNHRIKLWGPSGHEWLDLEGEHDGTSI
jgi:DNA polymerase-1